MRIAIDRAGRITVPKPLRDELGLRAGQELEVTLRDGRIEIEPMPPLTAEAVREALERTRR